MNILLINPEFDPVTAEEISVNDGGSARVIDPQKPALIEHTQLLSDAFDHFSSALWVIQAEAKIRRSRR